MASYNDTILTNNGISILNRVLAGKCTITFTRAVSSIADYSGKTLSELQALTSLASIEQNGVATRFNVRSETMVSIDLLFTNKALQSSYEITTIGLYAQASDSSTEVLYAIATASDPETMPAYVDQKLAKFTLTLYTRVGQADKTSITITDEGVVKSINGALTPDVNGDVTVDDSSHAKFIEAELINGHLLVPLVDDSGNPITDPAGNQLIADEYLLKSIKLGSNPPVYPGTDNTVKLPVYTQAEIDAKLSAKADTISATTKDDVDAQTGLIYGMLAQNRLVTPLAGDDGMTLLDESGNALVGEARTVTSVNSKTPAADGSITIDDYYPKQAIDNRLEVKADLLQMEDEHNALQSQITGNADHLGDVDNTLSQHDKQITGNANHLGDVDDTLGKHTKQIADNSSHLASVDDTLGQHAEQISQVTGEASYALDQISTGQVATALSDGQGGYLTDESGNALLTASGRVGAVKLGNHQEFYPGADDMVKLPVYTQAEIDNRLEVKADLLQMEDEHDALQSQITDNTNHLGDVDDTLSQHAKQISSLDSKMPQAAYVPVVLSDKTDLNAMKTCGFFMIRNETINSPVDGWVYVKVLGTPDRLTQFAWQDINPPQQWCRWYDGNNWTPWTRYTQAL